MIYQPEWVDTGDISLENYSLKRKTYVFQIANLTGNTVSDLLPGLESIGRIYRVEGVVVTANGSSYAIPGVIAPSTNLTMSDGIYGTYIWDNYAPEEGDFYYNYLKAQLRGPAGTGAGTLYLTIWIEEWRNIVWPEGKNHYKGTRRIYERKADGGAGAQGAHAP